MLPLDRTFRALGDQTRLRILNLLLRGEQPVGDLILALNLPQSSISQHLAALREAEMVAVRRQGKQRYYSLQEPRSYIQAKVLDCVRECLNEAAAYRGDLLRLKRLRPQL